MKRSGKNKKGIVIAIFVSAIVLIVILGIVIAVVEVDKNNSSTHAQSTLPTPVGVLTAVRGPYIPGVGGTTLQNFNCPKVTDTIWAQYGYSAGQINDSGVSQNMTDILWDTATTYKIWNEASPPVPASSPGNAHIGFLFGVPQQVALLNTNGVYFFLHRRYSLSSDGSNPFKTFIVGKTKSNPGIGPSDIGYQTIIKEIDIQETGSPFPCRISSVAS